MMSPSFLFLCVQRSKTQRYSVYSDHRKALTSEKAQPINVWHIYYLKNHLKDWSIIQMVADEFSVN